MNRMSTVLCIVNSLDLTKMIWCCFKDVFIVEVRKLSFVIIWSLPSKKIAVPQYSTRDIQKQACLVVLFHVFSARYVSPSLSFPKFIIMQTLLMFLSFQSFILLWSFPLQLSATKFVIEVMNESIIDLFWRDEKYTNNSSESRSFSFRRIKSVVKNLCDVMVQHLLLEIFIIGSENCSVIFHVIDCNPVGDNWLRIRANQDSSFFYSLVQIYCIMNFFQCLYRKKKNSKNNYSIKVITSHSCLD